MWIDPNDPMGNYMVEDAIEGIRQAAIDGDIQAVNHWLDRLHLYLEQLEDRIFELQSERLDGPDPEEWKLTTGH